MTLGLLLGCAVVLALVMPGYWRTYRHEQGTWVTHATLGIAALVLVLVALR